MNEFRWFIVFLKAGYTLEGYICPKGESVALCGKKQKTKTKNELNIFALNKPESYETYHIISLNIYITKTFIVWIIFTEYIYNASNKTNHPCN